MRRLLVGSLACFLIAGTALAAGKGQGRNLDPHRYLAQTDGALVRVENLVDGRSWSAWSYRNGGEFDLAISVSTAPGVWSEPFLFGLNDGIDQLQPALAVDSRGATYLAFADGEGHIGVMTLQPGATDWSAPLGLGLAAGGLSAPSLLVVGNAVILGYRSGESVELHALPLLPAPSNSTQSIYDGPDPTNGHNDDDSDDSGSDDPTPDGSAGDLVPLGQSG